MNPKSNCVKLFLVYRRLRLAKFYRLNEHIQASNLRVLDAAGLQLGILTKTEALEKAREEELDLVEIAPNADPPVARIIDFKKLRYDENKKEQAGKKGGGSLKELWLSPRIADHDLQVRLRRADEFLKSGNKVKLTVKYKGREMAHPEFGTNLLQKIVEKFGDRIEVEREAKFEGRKLSLIIAKGKGEKNPVDSSSKQNGENEDQQINTEKDEADRQGQAPEAESTGGGHSQNS